MWKNVMHYGNLFRLHFVQGRVTQICCGVNSWPAEYYAQHFPSMFATLLKKAQEV